MGDQAAFCTGCGAGTGVGNKFCYHCGAPADAVAAVCVKCGVALYGLPVATGARLQVDIPALPVVTRVRPRAGIRARHRWDFRRQLAYQWARRSGRWITRLGRRASAGT